MNKIKDQLQEAKQALYEDVSAAVERYQSTTGIKIEKLSYVDSTYAAFPKTHFIGFSIKLELE